MIIYIVRHGETNANKEGYLQGWSEGAFEDKLYYDHGLAVDRYKFDN